MRDVVLYFACKYKGDFDKIYKAFQEREPVNELKLNEYKEKLDILNIKYTTILDPDYPEALKKIDYPPFVLFYIGDYSLIKESKSAVVGTRKPSAYGMQMTREVCNKILDSGEVVVSGLAKGIDRIAHLTNPDRSIGVAPCSLDCVYPNSNADLYNLVGLLVSEYPFNAEPEKSYFPKRNRIISGLSDKVYIVECEEKCGTMITAGFAIQQNKELIAVPHAVGELAGTNLLINRGATIYER